MTRSQPLSDADRGQVAASAAQVYEEFFVPAMFGQWAVPMIDAAGVRPGDRVLDVGCGTGVVARAASDRVGAEGEVVGIDPNDGMLTVARRAAKSVTWRAGTAEALPFPDGSFDRVLSQFALMFFEDRSAGIGEMARVLAPGGRVAVATWSAVEESPGYAAMVDLLQRLFGTAAAAALRAPFSIGDVELLRDLVALSFDDVVVARREGTARFESIEAWVHTDIRGWTLTGLIDDEDHERLLDEAQIALAEFTEPDGQVRFAVPALIATGVRPGPVS